MDRRKFLALSAAATSIVVPSTRAFAAGTRYPLQTIKIVVPFPAGGAVDASIRIMESKLREQLGQPIIIENKPGANGIVGATFVAHADPDGYTLLYAPREVFGVNPILQSKPAYDPLKDFAMIGIVAEAPYVLIANPTIGVASFNELIVRAKASPLAYASFGHGSMAHLNIEALSQHYGLKLLHVPYRGAPQAVQAVVTGEVQLTIATPPVAASLINDGKLRALAVGASKRVEQLPDVPTFADLQQRADLFIPAAFAIAAPARAEGSIVKKIADAVHATLADPTIGERLRALGLSVVNGNGADMTRTISADITRFGKLIKEVGLKVE